MASYSCSPSSRGLSRITNQATTTNAISDTITMDRAGEIKDIKYQKTASDSATFTLKIGGSSTHTVALLSDATASTSGAGGSGRTVAVGDQIVVAITAGASGARAYTIDFVGV